VKRPILNQLPIINVQVNGHNISAIVDTGSTLSIISHDCAIRYGLPITPESIVINQVNTQTKSIGRTTFNLSIANHTRVVGTHIMHNFAHQLLIGMDIGAQFDLHVSMATAKVHTTKRFTTTSPSTYVTLAASNQPTNHLSVDSLISKHSTVFAADSADVGRITIGKHHIRTLDHPAIALRPYRKSQADADEIRRQIQDLKAKNLIRDSTSPWSAPVSLVNKKDGSKRMVIDYRRLNAITIDDKQPLPLIQDVIDRLRGAKYFSTLDAASGYWHVAIAEDSIEKTAFSTADGHFEWLVMPFGLKNAPPTFQRIIQTALKGFLFNNVIVYLDDIIVFSEAIDEHLKLLDNIFTRLENVGIKLRRDKCQLARLEVEYLGHTISFNEVRPAPAKLLAVKEFPEPRNRKEVQRFLGLSGYFRRFINQYTKTAYPLTQLTRKDIDFNWGLDQQTAFNSLKNSLLTEPVLSIFDPKKEIFLHTDASKIGIGAILTQKDSNGHEKVIAYYSRRLNRHEEEYGVTQQECLAVVDSVDHFHVYLHGQQFTIISDHSALQWLFRIKEPKGRLYRWSIRLSVYNYKIVHRKGTSHHAPDALSRAPSETEDITRHSITMHLTTTELVAAQKDMTTEGIRQLDTRDGIITLKRRGVHKALVPESLRIKLLKQLHDDHNHPGVIKTTRLLSQHYWWPNMAKDIGKHVQTCPTCQLVKTRHQPTAGHQHPIPTPPIPLDLIAADTIVLGSAANNTRAKYIQVIIDHHSRYVWAYATATNTSSCLINIFGQLFRAIGFPKRLLTDNGTNYTSKQFQRFLSENHVIHSLTSTYYPQGNAICEKANHTIITNLRTALVDNPNKKWSTLLIDVISKYNSTPHCSTGYTPRFLMFGITDSPEFAEATVSLEEARKTATEVSDKAKQHHKAQHDSKHPEADFRVGDLVLRRIADNHPKLTKTSPRYEGPFRVNRTLGPVSYEINKLESDLKTVTTTTTAHSSQLVRFHPRIETTMAGE